MPYHSRKKDEVIDPNALAKDGSNTPTANISWDSNKITNLADPTAAQDAATKAYADSVGGASDHGALTGLSDDDHTQYHNDTRGDARYYQQSEIGSATASSGSDLVGDDATYSNFTPAAATVKGALSGIDTALASAGGDPISGATDNALVRADGATALQDASQLLIADDGTIDWTPDTPAGAIEFKTVNITIPNVAGNYFGCEYNINDTGTGDLPTIVNGHRVAIPSGFDGNTAGGVVGYSVDNRGQNANGNDAGDFGDNFAGNTGYSSYLDTAHNDGRKVGFHSVIQSSALTNYGVLAFSPANLSAGQTNIGIYGLIKNDTDGNCVGVAGALDTSGVSTLKPAVSCGIWGSNGASTESIMILQDNSSTVLEVKDGGELQISGDINHDGSNIGFFSASPVGQQTDIGALTDNSGGTADNTVAAVSGSGDDSTINNNFADLVDQINQLRDTLRNLGLMA